MNSGTVHRRAFLGQSADRINSEETPVVKQESERLFEQQSNVRSCIGARVVTALLLVFLFSVVVIMRWPGVRRIREQVPVDTSDTCLALSLEDANKLSSGSRCGALLRGGNARVPDIVHLVWPYTTLEPMSALHYATIAAIQNVLQPTEIMFHYHQLPIESYWRKARKFLTLREYSADKIMIFGRSAQTTEEISIVQRLDMLALYGGVTFDLDVIPLRQLTTLQRYEFVFSEVYSTYSLPAGSHAIIMGERNSTFLARWRSILRSEKWAELKISIPKLVNTLARKHPSEVVSLEANAIEIPKSSRRDVESFLHRRSRKSWSNVLAIRSRVELAHVVAQKVYEESELNGLSSDLGDVVRFVLKTNSTAQLKGV